MDLEFDDGQADQEIDAPTSPAGSNMVPGCSANGCSACVWLGPTAECPGVATWGPPYNGATG
jgi:hypothetical protein